MFNALTKKYKEKRGFTLMEVLVVVAIIAIIAVISVTGILRIRDNLAFRQKNDYAKSIFMAAQSHLTELRATSGLEQLQSISNQDANMNELDDPDTAKHEYEDYCFTYNDHVAYNIVLPVGSVESLIREQDVIIEYNPKTGNVYAVFYSEGDNPLYTQYTTHGLPRNAEGDEEKRRDMMLGYYDGSDLSGEELGLMEMEAAIEFDNGEEGLITVIIPTQDKDDPSFTIADDGNYGPYMNGLSVKLTIVGEMGGSFEIDLTPGTPEAPCPYTHTRSVEIGTGGANFIHITFPIDSLKDNGSFANLSAVDGVLTNSTDTLTSILNDAQFNILPGDNVSVTAEVTYASSATDPIVEIEEAMVAGVNPMFHSLTAGSASDRYILTLSNGRNLQNLNALSSTIAAKVESVIFVNPDGSVQDIVIDWNDTVDYYNEKYGSGSVYSNTAAEAPARALPHFVPIRNDYLLTDVILNGVSMNAASVSGNGVQIYDLNVDVSVCDAPGNYYASAADNYDYAGLFAYVNTSIDGIRIANPVIHGRSSTKASENVVPATGALIGIMGTKASVTDCGVYADTEDIDFVRSKLNMSSFDGSEGQYGVSGSGAVGGLIGYSMSTESVNSSFAAVPVYGTKSTSGTDGFGGLVGVSSQTGYQKCYASGTVTAQSTTNGYGAGGFVGTSSNSNYTNCFATGDVTTSTSSTGGCAGFVGILTGNTAYLSNCYSIGFSSLTEDFCGFISTDTSVNSSNNFYLSQTQDQNARPNTISKNCATVKIYDEMQQLITKGNFDTSYWGASTVLTTHAYDARGNNAYPFAMLLGMDYYGNWPRKPLDAGIAYYEIYDTNGDGTADTFGYYFDQERTSTLLSDYPIISDGYMILAGTESDEVTVTSVTPAVPLQQPSDNDPIKDVITIEDDGKSYAVFPLTSTILDNGNQTDFYTALEVTIKTTDGETQENTPPTTLIYRFFYNPNIALSHYNPAVPVISKNGTTQENTATNPGQAPSTIYIRTARQLAAVGKNMSSFWGKNYIQQLDIDFNEYKDGNKLNPAPIGNGTTAFTGSYIGRKDDGSVPKIIGYKPADTANTGIFGVIGENGVVRNLNIETGSSAISGGGNGTTSIGLLAGKNQGTVEKVNVTVNGNVTLNGSTTAGLLVGENSGNLINCHVSQTAGTATLNAAHAGGLVGTVSKGSELEMVSVTLNSLSGDRVLAGVFGKVGADVTISDIPFLFTGTGANITSSGTSSGSAAGFVGESAGTITDCSVRGTGTISGTTSAAGFAVTVSGGTVDGCVVSPALADTKESYAATNNTNLSISGASAAGFAVENNASIRNSTALGNVTCTSSDNSSSPNAAGFVVTNSGTIEYCMSNVDMTAGTVFAKTNSGTVKECYGWASEGASLDSAQSTGKYIGSYFGTRVQEASLILFDFDGVSSTISTYTLAQPTAFNKLTGGSGRSVWTSGGTCDEYPYNKDLSDYPYPMLREHYGDWPEVSGNYPYGVLYYEQYADGYGVKLINMNLEYTTTLPEIKELKDDSTTEVKDAGYALFCKLDTTPFCNETNAMMGDLLPDPGLYTAIGLDSAEYGLYRLKYDAPTAPVVYSSDLEVTVENINRTVSIDLIPLFADTLENTREPFSIRTQEHLENIKHLPDGEFVIDRCFSVNGFDTIDMFTGELVGENGAKIIAAGMTSGLINNANHAVINGVNLTATMSVKLEPASTNIIGTLVNEATNSTITNCTIQTDINIYADEMDQGSITIGGIVGQMYGGSLGGDVRTDKDGSQIPNIHVTGTITANRNIASQLSCTVGGAVGLSTDSANIFGDYENVSASVIIDGNFASSNANLSDPNSGKYISPYGSIGEFVGFVNGGYFTNCTATDSNHPYEFFGGIQAISKKVDNITHFQNASSGPLTPVGNGTVEAVMVFHFDNVTFEGCSGDKPLPMFEAEKYFYNNSEGATQKYERSESPIAATVKKQEYVSAAVLKEAANINNGKTEYFIYDESDEAYYRITVHYEKEVVDSETGGTIETEVFTFSYTDQYGNYTEQTWPASIEESGCDFLYKISFALDSSLEYVLITADMNNAIILSDNGITYQSAPNDLSVNANMICNGDANTLRGSGDYSTIVQIPDTYSNLGGFTMIDSNNQSVTINGNDHFLVFEAHQIPDAISYKCEFVKN